MKTSQIVIAIVVVILLAGGAYYYFQNENSLNSSSDSAPVEEFDATSTSSTNTADMQSYTSSNIGVTMSYPSTWQLNRYDTPTQKGFGAVKNLGPKENIAVQILLLKPGTSLSSAVTTQRNEMTAANEHILKDENVTVAGNPAHLLELTYVQDPATQHVLWVFIAHNSNIYSVEATGEDKDWSQIPIASMLDSFIFTQ